MMDDDGIYYCDVCNSKLPHAKAPPGKVFVEIFCSKLCYDFAESTKARAKEIVKAVFNDEGLDV